MTSSGGEFPRGAIGDERTETVDLGRVSFLEQALWKQFGEAATPEAFARAWLGLQCTQIGGVERGVVVLGEPEHGPFAPIAYWPLAGTGSAGLAAAAERAMAERRGVAQGVDGSNPSAARQPSYVAYPFVVDGQLFGVAALELEAGRGDQLRGVMRQLQWGCGWIEVMLRREHIRRDKAQLERMSTAFDLAAVALEQHRFRDACNAIVTELAMHLDCDQVSVGFLRRRSVTVTAISHAAQFGNRMNLVRTIGAAMDEAVDQEAVVLFPARGDWEYRIDRAHRELASATGAGAILTVPLYVAGRFFGAITFERPKGHTFEESDVALCDCVANVVGPLLEEKRQNDRLIIVKIWHSVATQVRRLFGPRYFGRKLATAAAVAVVAFFAYAHKEYAVTAPAKIEGSVQRALVAPFQSYIVSQFVRAGDVVKAGELMATLDDKNFILERLKWIAKEGEDRTKYAKALAEQKRADAQIIQAQLGQAVAQIRLLDEEISHTRITAPFNGVVISGDLSQSVGAAVKQGDQLFTVAPLNSYRVILNVDERDITNIRRGQKGTLLVESLPLHPFHYVVTRMTPIAEVQNGANTFRVEAALDGASDLLRPGMKGVSKTDIEQRLLIRIWTQRLVDWVRMALWKWLP